VNPFLVCSGGGERGVRQARPEGVAGMEHQRRPLHRRRHGRHRHRRQQQLQPRHQVRMLRAEHHRLPRHEAVSLLLTSHVLLLRPSVVRRMACMGLAVCPGPMACDTSLLAPFCGGEHLSLKIPRACWRIQRCFMCLMMVFVSENQRRWLTSDGVS
jgi:hypothetical protein